MYGGVYDTLVQYTAHANTQIASYGVLERLSGPRWRWTAQTSPTRETKVHRAALSMGCHTSPKGKPGYTIWTCAVRAEWSESNSRWRCMSRRRREYSLCCVLYVRMHAHVTFWPVSLRVQNHDHDSTPFSRSPRQPLGRVSALLHPRKKCNPAVSLLFVIVRQREVSRNINCSPTIDTCGIAALRRPC